MTRMGLRETGAITYGRRRSPPTLPSLSHTQSTLLNISTPLPSNHDPTLDKPLPLQLREHMSNPPPRPALLPKAPPNPSPWLWQCHLCGRVYSVGVTRRCLEDGHIFCSAVQTLTGNQDEDSSSSGQVGMSTPKPQRRQSRIGNCHHQFDYMGWDRYNRWRREVAKSERSSIGNQEREDGDQRDCWNNCDYPGECHHKFTGSPETWVEAGQDETCDEGMREALDTPLSPSVDFSIPLVGLGAAGEEEDDGEGVEDIDLDEENDAMEVD